MGVQGQPSVGELRIVDLDEVGIEQVLELLNLALGPGSIERSEEFFRWKHERNPFGKSFGLGAIAGGGRLVSLRLFLRWRFWASDREIAAVRAVDTATHPEWQRRGLFRRLTMELMERVAAEGTAFVFNTPNAKSRPGYLSMGWQALGRLPLLVRPRWQALLPGRHRSIEEVSDLRPLEDLLAVAELPEFLRRWSVDEPSLHTVRSIPYLSWRYAGAPGLRYRAAWRLDEAAGAVVIVRQRERSGRSEISLSEVLVHGGAAAIGTGIDLVRRITADAGDYAVALGALRVAERRVLRGAGFLPTSWMAPQLTWRPLGAEAVDFSSARWRLSAGDAELF